MKKQIEIEYRAKFNKVKFKKLKKLLGNKAKDLGKDNKDVYFFIFSNYLRKLTLRTNLFPLHFFIQNKLFAGRGQLAQMVKQLLCIKSLLRTCV